MTQGATPRVRFRLAWLGIGLGIGLGIAGYTWLSWLVIRTARATAPRPEIVGQRAWILLAGYALSPLFGAAVYFAARRCPDRAVQRLGYILFACVVLNLPVGALLYRWLGTGVYNTVQAIFLSMTFGFGYARKVNQPSTAAIDQIHKDPLKAPES